MCIRDRVVIDITPEHPLSIAFANYDEEIVLIQLRYEKVNNWVIPVVVGVCTFTLLVILSVLIIIIIKRRGAIDNEDMI